MTTHEVAIDVPPDADLDLAGETVTVDVADDETVLGAARRQGVWLPADCQTGWCCTCAAVLDAGSVDQRAARRYFDVDREAGFILPCTATPESDLALRSHQYEAMLDHRAAHGLPPGTAKRGGD